MAERQSKGNRTALWALGLATIFVGPSAYDFFHTVGVPFDSVFVPNFYIMPLEARFQPVSLLIALALATVAAIALAGFLARRLGLAFPLLRLLVSFLAVIYVLNFLRSGVLYWFTLGEMAELFRANTVITVAAVVAVIAAAIFVLGRYRHVADDILTRILQATGLVSIVLAFNLIAAIVVLFPYLELHHPLASPTPATGVMTAAPRQFVWMIFDKADEEFIFRARDASISLPNFDRLKARAISATGMSSPGASTFVAIPALTLGGKVPVMHGTPNSPLVKLDGEFVSWSDAPTVFSDVRESGGDVTIVAQMFEMGAICRVFARVVSRCWQEAHWRGEPIALVATLGRNLDHVFRRFLYAIPLVRYAAPGYFAHISGQGLYPPGHFPRILSDMRDVVIDEIGRPMERNKLLYVHWHLPHPPYIYDRHKDELTETLTESDHEGYLGNLELADRVLGDFLDALEASDNKENTTLLVTADHGFHSLRVPYLFLSPDIPHQMTIRENLVSSSTRSLINRSLQGKLTTVEGLKRILNSKNHGMPNLVVN